MLSAPGNHGGQQAGERPSTPVGHVLPFLQTEGLGCGSSSAAPPAFRAEGRSLSGPFVGRLLPVGPKGVSPSRRRPLGSAQAVAASAGVAVRVCPGCGQGHDIYTFSPPDPQSQGHLSLEDTSVFLKISKGVCLLSPLCEINSNFLDKKAFSVFVSVPVAGAWSAACAGRPLQGGPHSGAAEPPARAGSCPTCRRWGVARLFRGACRGPGPARASRPLLHGTLPCAALSLQVRRTRPPHLRRFQGLKNAKVFTSRAPWNVDNSGPKRKFCVMSPRIHVGVKATL